MSGRMRDFDWDATPFGALADWPPPLRAALSLCLGSQSPAAIWWGDDARVLYNDAYIPFLGAGKHPGVLGLPGAAGWPGTWAQLGAHVEGVLHSGDAALSEDEHVFLARHLDQQDVQEEVYASFAYEPLYADDGSIAGVFCLCSETTPRMQGERRLTTLRALSACAAQTGSVVAACECAADILAANGYDVPFSAIYAVPLGRTDLELVASSHLDAPLVARLHTLADARAHAWPLDEVFAQGETREFALPSLDWRGDADSGWPEAPRSALAIPLRRAGVQDVSGIAVLGVSPRCVLDDSYRAFFDLVAASVEAVVASALGREALQAANRQKTEFLAMLAHELRNPLAPIRHVADRLGAEGLTGPQAARCIDILRRQAAVLSRLVDDLLDMSRITLGRVQLHKRGVLLQEIIAQSLESVDALIRERQHRLTVTSEGAARVDGDPQRLVQCLVNVLTNAAKYTGKGGELHIESFERDGFGALRVRDTGQGIAPELIEHIFDLFVQSERTLDRAQGGLGLGLSLVKKVMELHGGHAYASSDGVGHGTTVTLEVPLADYDAVLHEHEPEAAPPETGGPLRVLVVDDNADAADSLAMLLEAEGHAATAVYDADAVLNSARQFAPDAIVLDIGLPKIDGYQMAQRIRATPDLAHITLIAATGYGQPEDRARAFEAGFGDHLVKPVTLDALRRALAKARR
ncbi:Histidine kinase [Paraburkholderia tropica]|uniref:hybrid sensor histidine kinase/response regulator n=1 Tax=Paraburkholderia tropica TaxID=92647 RepID=UPI001CAD6502|nr:ATP-binding protein [Paraburkholderia tropica]CAG9239145.1 Histidine kinase [Paraburkholderia tropica]